MSLVLRDISHHFGKLAAVDGAGLEAAPGEILCLFGPSGCGKTTLLRIAAGLEKLQGGTVSLGGETLAGEGRDTPPEKRPIGFVFQDFVLFPHLTVEKNVAFGVKGSAGAKARVRRQLDAMDIAALAKRYPHELSGGQQQRVALARALVREPKALLLDEPFASIDSVLRRKLREDLRQMLKAENVAVVMVTHDPEEALAIGDRVALMRAGRVVETATPEALFTAPQTPQGAMIFPHSQEVSGRVEGGVFTSCVGERPAGDLPDGPARLVLRADAIAAAPNAAGGFRVSDYRFSGPGWTVYLEDSKGARLSAQMADAPETGAPMGVTVDWSRAFMFSD